MRADVYAEVATRIEGPLLFLKRTVMRVSMKRLKLSMRRDARLGRIAALDHEPITVEVLESTAGLISTIPGCVFAVNR